MKILKFILAGLVLVLFVNLTSCDKDVDPIEMSNINKARAILGSIQTGDVLALQKYLNQTHYAQHNLTYPEGAAAFIAAIESGAFTGTIVEPIRWFADDDIVVIHSEYTGTWNNNTAQVVFDIFRFENGLVVEHWDNLTNTQDDGDGTTQLDGVETPATDLTETEDNRVVIENMTQDIFIDGKYSTLTNFFDTTNYVQHSVGYGTDIQPLLGFFNSLPEGTPFYQSIKYIHVEGDFALSMSQGFPNENTGLSLAYFDLFRLTNGKIVEHWDVVQEIPAEADWANTNGKW